MINVNAVLNKTRTSILYALILCLLGFTACSSEEETTLERYDGPMVEFKSIRTYYSEDALLKLKLVSPLQLIQSNGDVFYPEGMTINVYDEEGTHTTILEADTGRFIKDLSLYVAAGKVHVHNIVEEQHLETERLNWNQKKGEIHTEEEVLIRTAYEVIRGVGLTSDERFETYQIHRARGAFDVGNQQNATAPEIPENDPARQLAQPAAPVNKNNKVKSQKAKVNKNVKNKAALDKLKKIKKNKINN